jgi:hypothetical protein
MASSFGFQHPSPFARSREKPKLPIELLDITEDEYAAQLREYGYGEDAIKQELDKLRIYLDRVKPKDQTPPVAPGPVKGTLFNDWASAARRRRKRKEHAGDETDEQ